MNCDIPGLVIMHASPRTLPIHAFDLDHTLIKPKSGAVHPRNSADWEWYDDIVPAMLTEVRSSAVIISNQGRLSLPAAREEFFKKMNAIFESLGFTIPTYIAYGAKFRKPSPLMWAEVSNIVKGPNESINNDEMQCIYVGDAAGRPGDFADSDYKFALNCGLGFMTPEMYFLGTNFIPHITDTRIKPCLMNPTVTQQLNLVNTINNKIIVFVGAPASGKSTFAQKYFTDCQIICQDTINLGRPGTRKQCIKALRSGLANVVIDSTSPLRSTRAELFAAAGPRVKVIVHFNFPEGICKHLNFIRTVLGGRNVPEIAIKSWFKKIEIPDIRECDILITLNEFCADVTIPGLELHF